MRFRVGACIFLLLCVLALPAEGAVTPEGRSGLVSIPTAYILQPLHGSAGYFNLSGDDVFAGSIAIARGFELGYSRWRLDDKEYNVYSGKVALLEERVLKPAVAVGVDDLSDAIDRSYYLVASKQAPWGIRLHLGVKSGQDNGLFYGLEKQIRLDKNWRKKLPFIPVFTLMMEYDGQHFNYGVYVREKHGLRFDLGWRDERFYGGIQLEF